MANIHDLNINVVKKFVNNKTPLSNDQIYDEAFNMMQRKSTS